jgi:AbrB family looped-hinge helix DNA binding protein
MGISIVSEKGWVVVPQELRERYGLKKGDKVRIVDYGGIISIVPVRRSIAEGKGMLRGHASLTAALAKSRKEDASRGK